MRGRRLIGIVALLAPLAAQAEALDNAAIVALSKAGLGAGPILAKVRQAPCGYDTSAHALIALKQAGVPEPVIVAMVDRCAGSDLIAGNTKDSNASIPPMPVPGIYLDSKLGDKDRLTMLRPAAQASVKQVGNGSILFPNLLRLIVPQPHAPVTSSIARPTFYFSFDPADRHVSGFGEVGSNAAQSPNEFSLVRLRPYDGNRQVPIGRAGPFVAIAGIDPKNTLAFSVDDLGHGAFKVSVGQDLEPGEYGFVLLGERERRSGAAYRIYDFAVAAPAAH